MGLITRIAGKTGALGSVVSAMGCAACFPAIASFGAAIGLGFLSQYEGLFTVTYTHLTQPTTAYESRSRFSTYH